MLRAPLAQTLAAIGVDTEIEMRSAALGHRQAVAHPVVAPVPGGPDAEARHPDPTAPNRQPIAELRLQTAARCRASGRHPGHCLLAPERLGAAFGLSAPGRGQLGHEPQRRRRRRVVAKR